MKRYKKSGFVLILAFMLMLFPVKCRAQTKTEIIDTSGYEALYDSLPDEVKDLFGNLGIENPDFDSLFNVEIDDIVNVIKKLVTGSIESPLNSMVRILSVVVIIAVFICFVPDDPKIRNIMEVIGNLVCVISILNPISLAITSAVSSVTVSEKFMLLLIPVLTSVLSVSGSPTLASSFQTVALGAAQVIALVATKVIVPAVGVILALDIGSSLMPGFKISELTSCIKKIITTTLSFSATLFVGFLGLKGGLATAADTVLGKGVKLVISSAVPVVGGALSEAYSGVIGSMVLVKSTLGVFGIGAIALINLPSCIQLLFWIFSLKISAAVADLFELRTVSSTFKALASSLVLLNVVIVFVGVLFIISTALILVMKAR